jgi:hypothetical protein
MCDINKVLDIEEAIAYKVILKDEGDENLYSCFSGYKLEVGPVREKWNIKNYTGSIREYSPEKSSFNKNMIGRVSGFINILDAINLCEELNSFYVYKILQFDVVKMVLRGELMGGTATNICVSVPSNSLTIAGKEIVSIEKI